MIKVGLTGGIGSGKTTVCKIFASLGIPVYYADPRAKWLMNHNLSLKKEVKSLLGSQAYHRNGRLNRTYVASKIFSDTALLEKINQIVHPVVHKDAAEWMALQKSAPYILYEAALLLENGSHQSFDKIIVVTAPEKIRIDRVMKRDGVTKAQVKARIKNQLPQEQKDDMADYLVINDESHSLIQQVVDIHKKLTTK